MTHNCDVALRYAAADFKVFPCDEDKRPLIASWATEATKDPATIRALWAAHPHAPVGLPMKPHGLLAFDADRHREGEDGVAHFRALCAEHEPLPPHPIVLTANGGEHHIFRMPTQKIGNRKLGNGLETRGYKDDNDGGYVIAAGSRLPDGRSWRLANGSPSLLNATLPEPPAWLVEHARERREEQRQPEPDRRAGKREESYAAKALDNLARDLATMAPETGRNDCLNIAALKLGTMVSAGWIGEATVTGRLFDACKANGLVDDAGAKAVNATIQSGLKAGLAQPHPDLQDREREAPQEDKSTKHSDPTAWQRGTFSAPDLQTMDFPPFAWIVQDILPAEGAALLCSRPKFGKSWFALDLCLGCAVDRFILGTIKPKQGSVLYLALEDSKRRLQRRMTKLLPFGSKWPGALALTTEWRRLHEGGLEDIRAWYDHTRERGGNPILVVVDVLAKVRKPTGRAPQYEADYEALTGITKLANELGIAILVIHHIRKMQADDLMEMVSGTYGVTGAVDTILVMANKPNGTVLDIRGRDAEQAELAIEFEKATCRWRVLGDAVEIHRSEQQNKILAALRQAGEPLGVADLEQITEIKRDTLGKALYRLANEGTIKRVGRGLYAMPDWQPPPEGPQPHSGKSGKRHQPLPDALPRPNPLENVKKTGASGKSGSSGSLGTPSAVAEPVKASAVLPAQTLPELPECPNAAQATGETPESKTSKSGDGKSGLPELPDCSTAIPEHVPSDYDAILEELSARGEQPPWRPRGTGWQLVGDLPPSHAKARVWLKEQGVPALGPAGDDVFDLDPTQVAAMTESPLGRREMG